MRQGVRFDGPESATLAVLTAPSAHGIRIEVPFCSPPAIARELAALLDMPADRIDVRVHRSAQSEQETRDAGSGAGIAALLCGECMAPLSLLMETGAEAAHPTPVELRAPSTATFAQEAFVDELAEQAGTDPVAYRLAHLRDPLRQ